MDYPRWGIILSVVATRNLKAGEELYGYYGYKRQEFPADFPWYWELKMKVDKEQRLQSNAKKK